MSDTVGGADVEISVDDGKARRGLKGFLGYLQNFGKSATRIAAGMAIFKTVEAGINVTGKAVFGLAMDMQKSQGKMQASLGLTAKEAHNLGNVAKDVWKQGFGDSVDEASEAVEKVRQNMGKLNNTDLTGAAKSALTLKQAFGAEVGESTKTASTLMRNFGITSKHAFDLMTVGFQKGGDYSGELLDTLNEYSPQFKDMGMSADQMMNMLIKGAKAGAFNLDKVGDAVKEFNIRAQDGSTTTQQGFQAIGLNAAKMGEAISKGGKDGQEAFMATVTALAKMKDPVKQNIAGVNLFGTQWEDVRKNVIFAMGSTTNELGKVSGATNKAGNALSNNFGAKAQMMWRRIQAGLEPVGLTLINMANGGMNLVVTGFNKMAKAASAAKTFLSGDWSEGSKQFADLFGEDIGRQVSGFFLQIYSGIQKAKQAMNGLVTFVRGVFAIFNDNTGKGVSILVSLGLSASQVQQVINAINLIKKYLAMALQNMTDGVKLAGQFIIAAWNVIWPYLKPGLIAIFSFIKSIMNQMMTFWKQNGATIMAAIHNVMNIIIAILRVAMPIIAVIVRSVWDNVKGIIQGALNIIMGLVKIFAGLFTGQWGTVWSGIKQVFSGAISFIWNAFNLMFIGKILKGAVAFGGLLKSVFSSMWAFIKALWNGSIGVVVKLVTGHWKQIEPALKAPFTAAYNAMKTIWSVLKTLWNHSIGWVISEIKSHWSLIKSVFMGPVNAIKSSVGSFWSGLKSLWNKSIGWVISEVKGHWSSVTGFFKHPLTSMKNLAADAWDAIVKGAKALPGRIGSGIKSMAGKAISGVKSMANSMAKWIGKGVNGVINGVDWVLNKIGIKGKPVPTWPVPQYKNGTGGHPKDGPAFVGDGGEREMIIQDGKVGLSPARATLTWLKKGAQVISGPITKRILSGELPFPAYANGIGGIESAIVNGAKSAVSAVKNIGIDVFNYAAHPSKLLGAVLNKMGFSIPDNPGGFGKIALGAVKTVKDKATTFIKNKVKGLLDFGATKVSGNVSNWIDTAMSASGISGAAWKSGLGWIISHESSGNPNAVGAMTSTGTAKGLMQLMDFNIKGNPFNPINNIIAGIRYIKSRYKTIQRAVAFWKSHHWYAKGTNNHPGGDAVVGEEGWELGNVPGAGNVILGARGMELIKNFPKGSSVLNHQKSVDLVKNIPHYASGTKGANAIRSDEVKYSTKQISASKFIASLKAIRKEYKLTSAEQNKIMMDIYRANNAIKQGEKEAQKRASATKKRREAALKAEKAARDSVNKSVLSDSTAYLKKVQSINDTLVKNIKSAQDNYKSQLSDKTNSIYSQVGLFDSADNTVSYKQDLSYQLKEQLQTQKQFTSDLAKLSKKTPASFVTELRNMGIGSASQIHALTTMTSKELSDYIKMWKEKHSLASKEATIEMEPAKKSMNDQIDSLKKSAEKQLSQAKTDFINKLKGLIPEVSKMGSLKNKSSALGKYAVSGLISGLKSMDGPLKSQAKSIAKTIENEIRKTLKIHSPSRVTFSLGQFIGQGLHQGITNFIGNIRDAAHQMSLAAIPAVPSAAAMGSVTNGFAAAAGGTGSTGTASEKPTFNFYGDMHIHNDDDYDKIAKKLADRYANYQSRNRGRS